MRLRPRKAILNDFFVWDTETGVNKNNVIEWQLRGRPENFIFGCIVGKNYRKEIHDIKELRAEFLHPRYKNKKVFAHNAEYDLNVLYGCIFSFDPKAIFNGKFICASNGNCQFADSLNIYRTSVKEIGKMLGEGFHKMGMDQGSYKKSNWNKKGVKQRDINACFRDCEIIYEALFRIFEEAGDIKITQASLSMTYYRRYHQPFDIEHNENTAFFFDSYFGGRTEVFKRGKTHSTVIDRNSSYPAEMFSMIFPNPAKLKVATNVDVKTFRKFILPHYEGLIYADILHKPKTFGFLPVKKDGKLLFPVGSFSGCWNFNELRFALQHDAIQIKRISKAVYAPPMFSPFKNYVDHLYSKRSMAEKGGLEEYSIKIFMNSLYGKFAQRINEETIYIENIEKEINTIREYQRQGILLKVQPFNADRLDAFLILKATKKIDISFCIPSFASYITSGARIALLKQLLLLEKNIPTYCDTDSVAFEINNGVKSNYRLGEWKIEDKIITEVISLKNYKFEYFDKKEGKLIKIHRTKGVPKNAKKIKSKNNVDSYIYYNLGKTKEAMRRGFDPGTLIKREKTITGEYDKRIVLANGETEPIIL